MFKTMADLFVSNILKITAGTHLHAAVSFFIYDTIKIFLLLAVIIFIVTYARTFLPRARIRALLSHRRAGTGNILAAAFGIITPFCTCSAIPLFMGFLEAGVPLGVTFSFLVSSPMINEVALALLFATFGWKISALYVVSGFLIAVASGWVIGRLRLEHLLTELVRSEVKTEEPTNQPGWRRRLAFSRNYTVKIIKKVWPYILLGVGLGAGIHGYVPSEWLAQYAGSGHWYAVPMATLLGVPLYSNAAGIVPLVSVLTEKGVDSGTVLAFMMAVTALSLPEFLILRRVMKTKLIVIFAAIVAAGIIFTGYLFNAII